MLAALVALFEIGCLRPLPLRDELVVQEVFRRYEDFFPPQPSFSPGVGLLRPRFGVPAIAQVGASFSLETVEKAGARPARFVLLQPGVSDDDAWRCLRGETDSRCLKLKLAEKLRRPIERGSAWVEYRAEIMQVAAPGGYDLVLAEEPGNFQRSPNAVWLRRDNPDELPRLRVAHLSDLHVGKGNSHRSAENLNRLFQIVTEINQQVPDLVVVTGDLVHHGQISGMQLRAQQVLRHIQAPVLVILGNHDIEFGVFKAPVRRYGAGWVHFARAFHPLLHYTVSLGGYDFVGFDSGPAVRSFRILTRGLHRDSLDTLELDLNRALEQGRRGVVLFSHAPSRAVLSKSIGPTSAGFFGRMDKGRADFERLLIEGGRRGLQMLHLAGHTHWSDVFDLVRKGQRPTFRPWRDLSPCLRPLRTPVGMVTTQAASHAGVAGKRNARGFGFSLIELGEAVPRVATMQHMPGYPTECPNHLVAAPEATSGTQRSILRL